MRSSTVLFFFCVTCVSSFRAVVEDPPPVVVPPPPPGHKEDPHGIEFGEFIANDDSMTCNATKTTRMFNNQIRGVNLGGWLVLEPWITPSLFYQFLGGNESTTAMDMFSFCQVLGAKEANRQLRHHWDRWVTKEIIAELAASGAVNSLRLPGSSSCELGNGSNLHHTYSWGLYVCALWAVRWLRGWSIGKGD